jgi:hypothetical protein
MPSENAPLRYLRLTPLLYRWARNRSMCGHLEVVRLLLAQGADMQALTEVADAAVRGCSRASSLCAEAHGAASDGGE